MKQTITFFARAVNLGLALIILGSLVYLILKDLNFI